MTTQTIPETTVPLEPTRERTARDVLLGAARYIEEHGWTSMTRPNIDHSGKATCADLAIEEVDGGSLARHWFAYYLGGSERHHIWAWNDDPDRTEAEVIAALRAAADTAP